MNCLNCQSENREGVKFCEQCGARMEVVCPGCGARILPGKKFCGDCGYDLMISKQPAAINSFHPESYTPKFLADKILSNRSSIEGERKLVTVMFADVANFTSISEKLDPEEVHTIMDGCFRILMEEIHKYEGTINQFRGDGVMALFGAPVAHEDHASRACHAALGMKSALAVFGEELKAEFGLEFRMRIGLSSGTVVVGSIGDDLRMDYTADGDTTNLASRMESMADPGSIFVSRDTYKKIKDLFQFKPLGKLSVKGKEDSLEVYELTGKRHRDRSNEQRKVYSQLVGRQEELGKLKTHVLKVVNGEGSIVNLYGDAGIGKSRLIAELKRNEAIKGVSLLEGRAMAIGKNLSFHPVIEILKYWALINEGDSEEKSLGKIERALEAVYPHKKDEVFPFIATIMGFRLSGKPAERVRGIEGEALEKLILKNIRDLLLEASKATPIVLILEDLQWSDLTTIKYLESLLHLAEKNRILFINVFRPGYNTTSDRVLALTRHKYSAITTDILLETLAPGECELLIKDLIKIKALPLTLRRKIIQVTDGNPFFIEEMVRSFIEKGVLGDRDRYLRITERIDSVIMPETIHDVLLERIDRLESEAKDLLKTASVIGRNFFYKVLNEIAKPPVHIDRDLEYLIKAQFIRQRKRMGEIEFIFKHALIQEAAYGSILLNKRRDLHLRTAGAIETVFKETLHKFYGILAYHYIMGDDIARASEYLLKAGEEALKSAASSEALYYYQECLKIYKMRRNADRLDPDKLFMLENNIALAFFNKGQYPEALVHLDKALDIYGIRPSKRKISIATLPILDLLSLLRDLYFPSKKAKKIPDYRDHAIFSLMEKKLISLAFNEPRRYFVEFLRALRWASDLDITKIENGPSRYSGASVLFSWTGLSFKLSRKILKYADELVQNDDVRGIFDHSLFQLYYNFFKGNWTLYDDLDQNILEHNLQMGRFWQVSTYIFFLCSIRISQGAFADATRYIVKLAEILESFDNENTRQYIYSSKIALLVKTRKLETAQREIGEGIQFACETGKELVLSYYLGFKAITQILLKDFQGALESLAQADETVAKEQWKIPHFISSCVAGRFLLDLHLLEESIRAGTRSQISRYRKRAQKIGKKAVRNCKKYASAKTEIFRLMGTHCWLCNRHAKAVNWWRMSLSAGRELGDKIELARTYMEIGKRLLENKTRFQELDGIKSETYFEMARMLFKELDLQWDLNEVQKLMVYKYA